VKKHKKENSGQQVQLTEEQDGEFHDAKTGVVSEEFDPQNINLKTRLEEKEKEAKDNYDRYLRAVAELDNYKKRAMREKADILKYGKEDIIKDILPFLDSLDRALEHAGGNDAQAFKDGIALIQDQLLCCLKKHGVEKIESAGHDFDPNFHEAVMQLDSKEHEDNKIVSEMGKGYLLNGRLLRPSRVCVCKKINKETDVCEKIEENGQ
jgi:molecular chaperone GrpE